MALIIDYNFIINRSSLESIIIALPTPALPVSGSEGLISALVLRHPYCLMMQIYKKQNSV